VVNDRKLKGRREPAFSFGGITQECIARREQKRIAGLFGKLDWDASFDYKSE
jgi:hypothetical protein